MDLSTIEIETPRLRLRPPRPEDFDDWAAFMADPDSTHYLGGPQPRSAAWRGFLTMAGAWQIQGFGMFCAIEKSSRRWVGRVGPWQPEGWPGTEIGWGIAREYCGRGYATEAASATIDWAVAELGWTDVIHVIDPRNTASQAVARKLGSRNRGPGRLPAPHEDLIIEVWGQTRDDWYAHTRGSKF
jgi:RimJ/RimL family protein N-acetyltransferase